MLEWFRFGKRIDEMGKEVERFKRKTEASHKRREQQLIELIKRCDELGEIEHIASEMAEALRRIRDNERSNYLLCDEMKCAECLDDVNCQGKIVDDALQKWEKWRNRHESNI